MNIGHITYDKSVAARLKGILWKDINQRHKNNYDAAIDEVLDELRKNDVETGEITTEIARIYEQVLALNVSRLPSRKRPPKAY